MDLNSNLTLLRCLKRCLKRTTNILNLPMKLLRMAYSLNLFKSGRKLKLIISIYSFLKLKVLMNLKNLFLKIMSYASKRSYLIIPLFSNRFENKILTCMGTWLTDVLTLHFPTCTLKINTTSNIFVYVMACFH